jgi:hypothetical protein
MPLRRFAVTAAVSLAAATGLAACGAHEEVHHGATEGVYVSTGGLKYQVQISRVLNPSDFEDQDYLKGLSAGDRVLPKDDEWFAVFMRVFNHGDAPHQASDRFTIEDTTGKRFEPVPLDRRANSVAFVAREVKPGDQNPLPGSLARENATQGGLVLFRVPTASLDNRPLVLHIESPEGGPAATVDLDV